MSYINKKGKTTSWRKMVIRQQVSEVIANNQIKTTLTKAKETRKHVDKIITLAKKDTLASKRAAAAILLDTSISTKSQLLQKLFNDLQKKYKSRNGGYTRILKLGKRQGDNVEEAILQLV
ncbi:MAG: 50S ribosomal protein L17 [Malacoplasma sp.]|nr:50S ribosomal protein L17 [Malacoplasma sp.]MDE5842050.1 50S ribosomal protein L17 [Malacoplasma sp.]MDE5949679.1 50S ribosomal protein L17 [Malacoplasma sp.]MDE6082541.1 50S ribosomal protein L17 [Malacoplasma sp.]MDE6646069.1 50S ribosomal protein L17 [Malacoplasma sp.]